MLTCPLAPHLALTALSACTCPASAPSHPRPSPSVRRGAPEINVFEVQKNKLGDGGKVSQFAPFAHDYVSPNGMGAASFFDVGLTRQNMYQGECVVSVFTGIFFRLGAQVTAGSVGADARAGARVCRHTEFVSFGFEHLGDPNDAGARYIMWQVDGKPSYAATEIAQRLIFDVDYSELGHVA
ncbi:hypothetical protein JB92DRAFT_3130630 [Gautieria morchelliformis]|nr:hypothetical protein JB92DRAFT_3130630 [Gautieria morchelliformis]